VLEKIEWKLAQMDGQKVKGGKLLISLKKVAASVNAIVTDIV